MSRKKKPGPWMKEWMAHIRKVKLIGARLGVPTFTSKTQEDYRGKFAKTIRP